MSDDTIPVKLPERSHNLPPEIAPLPILPPTEVDEAARAAALETAKAGIAADETLAYDLDVWAELNASTARFLEASLAWNRILRIETAEQSERLTDFVTGARAMFKKVDDARKVAKAPWDAGGKKVQAAFEPMLTKLEAIGAAMKSKQADWLKREQDRIAREKAAAAEAARLAREEAERLAKQAAERGDISGQVDAEAAIKAAEKAAKAAERPAKVQAGSATGAGRTMALRTQRVAQIKNPRACFMHFQNDPGVIDALLRAANAAIRAGITEDQAMLAGFEIIEKQGAA